MASEARRLDWRVVLEAVRLTRGHTRAEHARRAGLTGPGLTKIMRPESNPTLLSVERLANALGCRARVVIEPLLGTKESDDLTQDPTQHPAYRAGVEAGRREGLEAAAKACDGVRVSYETRGRDDTAADDCAREIRDLLDTKDKP